MNIFKEGAKFSPKICPRSILTNVLKTFKLHSIILVLLLQKQKQNKAKKKTADSLCNSPH